MEHQNLPVRPQKQDELFFSIVIPTFRRPDALKTSLRSLSLQDFSKGSFEVIVSNNNPRDNIDAIVNGFKDIGLNITSIDESRPGAHFARNSAVNVAKGKYILLMDDDCEADMSLLKSYQTAIEEFEPIIAAGRIDITWDSVPPNWVIPLEGLMGKMDFGPGSFWLKRGEAANGGNLLIRRDFYIQIGGMEPDQVGDLVLGCGDVGLSLTANRLGHHVLWVGSARVWHHQKREVNAKLRDLLRREFNNGILTVSELRKRRGIRSMSGLVLIPGRLILSSARQFLTGIVSVNLSCMARSLLTLWKVITMYWFFFFKSGILRRCT